MAVSMIKSKVMNLSATGILSAITDKGLVIDDEKNGRQILGFEMIEEFLGKKTKISFTNKDDE